MITLERKKCITHYNNINCQSEEIVRKIGLTLNSTPSHEIEHKPIGPIPIGRNGSATLSGSTPFTLLATCPGGVSLIPSTNVIPFASGFNAGYPGIVPNSTLTGIYVGVPILGKTQFTTSAFSTVFSCSTILSVQLVFVPANTSIAPIILQSQVPVAGVFNFSSVTQTTNVPGTVELRACGATGPLGPCEMTNFSLTINAEFTTEIWVPYLRVCVPRVKTREKEKEKKKRRINASKIYVN